MKPVPLSLAFSFSPLLPFLLPHDVCILALADTFESLFVSFAKQSVEMVAWQREREQETERPRGPAEGKIDSIVKSKLQGNEQLAAGSRD